MRDVMPWQEGSIFLRCARAAVFDASMPERLEAAIFARNNLVARHSTIDLQRKATLRRVQSLVGSGTSRPNGLFETGPHSELIGQEIDRDIFPRPSAFRSEIEQHALFHQIDKGSEFVPAPNAH